MKIVTSPNESNTIETLNSPKVFLAGSITGCPDWQSEFLSKLEKDLSSCDFTIYNPRRSNFVMAPGIEEEQIVWGYKHLKEADCIVFWFSKDSLGPIVLYELGRWANSSNKKVFIGVEEGYPRKNDVVIQTELSRPSIEVVFSLENLLEQFESYIIREEDLTVNV